MAVGENLGRAYIEVHADTAPFNQELQHEVATAAASVKPTARKSGDQMGQEIVKGARKGVKKAAPGLFADIKKIFQTEGRRGSFASAYGRIIGQTLMLALRRSLVGRLGREMRNIVLTEARSSRNPILGSFRLLGGGIISIFKEVGKSIGGIFSSLAGGGGEGATKGIKGIIQSIGASIGNVGSKGPLSLGLGAAIILGIPALVGAILVLIKVLGPLINGIALLPGLFFTAAAAIVPLVIGFQGFGTALAAIMSGDLQAFNEALKTLTPSARAVVLELQKLKPIFSDIRKAVQEKLFAQLTGGQLTATTKALAPIITTGSGQVAAAWGRFISSFLALLREPATARFFSNLFSTAATVLDRLGPGFLDTLRGLFRIADKTLPSIEAIADKFGGLLSKFGDWLIEQADNGNLDKFLDKFNEALSSLKELAKSGYHLLKAMLEGIDIGDAKDMFQTLLDVINAMTDFFKSDYGKQSLKGMVTLAEGFLIILGGIVIAWSLIAGFVQSVVDGIKKILEWVGVLDKPKQSIRKKGASTLAEAAAAAAKGTKHAKGTITTGPEIATIGEDGPEAVIPLTDPSRARKLMAQSGLDRLGGSGDTNVYVYLGNEQLEPYMVKVQRKGQKQFARDVRHGARSIGAVP